MTTRSPVTSWKPRRSAAPLPPFVGWRISLNRQLAAASARQHVARAVRRAVVDDDELDADRHGEHAPDDLLDRRPLVVHRHDDRQQRIGQDALQPRHQSTPCRVAVRMRSCQRQAVSTMASRSAKRGVQPELRARPLARRERGAPDRPAAAAPMRVRHRPPGHALDASMHLAHRVAVPVAEIVGRRRAARLERVERQRRARRPGRSRGRSRAGRCRPASGSRRRRPSSGAPPTRRVDRARDQVDPRDDDPRRCSPSGSAPAALK